MTGTCVELAPSRWKAIAPSLELAYEETAREACLENLSWLEALRAAYGKPSLELARRHYPEVPIRGDLSGQIGFFSCAKAERVLGWRHEEGLDRDMRET